MAAPALELDREALHAQRGRVQVLVLALQQIETHGDFYGVLAPIIEGADVAELAEARAKMEAQ